MVSWTLFCGGAKAGLELKYVTKITSIIRSDEILNRPHVCPHGPPILFIEHLSKAEVQFLVLRCLKLYSLKCVITQLIFNHAVLLGAPLQLGALSARARALSSLMG